MDTIKTIMTPSDAFWYSAPAMITAVGAILIALVTPIITYLLTKKRIKEEVSVVRAKLNEVGENVNGKIDQLLKGKDDLAKAKEADQKITDAKDAAFDAGELSALKQQKTDEVLKNTPPKQ